MQVGFVGSGNMAAALARGWGRPVLCTDTGSGRAQRLVDELGGEALATNAELAERADIIVLACKPAGLARAAAQLGDTAKPIVSVLARTSPAALREAFPSAPVFQTQPNTPVAVRRGVTLIAQEDRDPVGPHEARDRAVRDQVVALLEEVGEVVEVPAGLVDVAGGVSGVGPAYVALVAEAMVDAAVRRGIPADIASRLATATLGGTAELLREQGHDTLALRRGVTSPGGTTARGLAALERGGLRAAFHDAQDAVAGDR